MVVLKKNGSASDNHEASQSNKIHPADAHLTHNNLSAESLIDKGKDILTTEVGGVATAAAIILGAALIEVELIPGLVIGAGAIILGKIFPELTGYIRPAIKSAVRAGFTATHKVRQIVAETNEQVSDLLAEVKHEQDQIITQVHIAKTDAVNINELPTH